MADQYTNYTYAQDNYGVAGADSSGSDISGPSVANSWPAQTLNYQQLTNCDDYTGRKFGGVASWPDSTQPTGPAIDPTGAQKIISIPGTDNQGV